jgi:DNA-directed RNA polymerase specialized sigma24 family protein
VTYAPIPDSVEPILALLQRADRPFPFLADGHVPQARVDVAVELVLRWARPWVMRWSLAQARRLGVDRPEADDIASEVLLSLWRALPKYDQRRSKLCSYLRSCARYRLRSLSRQIIRRRRAEMLTAIDGDTDLMPAAADDDQHIYELIDRIVDRPDDYLNQRDAALLRVVMGPSPSARKAGFTHPSNYSRAIGRLKTRLTAVMRNELTP